MPAAGQSRPAGQAAVPGRPWQCVPGAARGGGPGRGGAPAEAGPIRL